AFIYIQMQLCSFSLTKWLSENKDADSRPLNQTKSWFKEIVAGVEYMHGKNFIHRDLKVRELEVIYKREPCNILFYEENKLKIADMGIVIERKIENGREITVDHNGSGTRDYMSPEQRSWFAELNAKSDVFTLGLILAEICVVMDYTRKVEIFDKYRNGTPNKIFGNDIQTETFVNHLTVIDKDLRP
ncbi:hypothetical protein PENTCL1PPCAC_10291, partial [Pristionchus entomophagus]